MKKLVAVLAVALVVSTIVSSCASRRGGCPTTNPRYFSRG